MRTSTAGSNAQRGFTLVELLIVMTIIGVSVTFAAASLQRMLVAADEEQWVASTLRELNRVKNRAILSGRMQQLTISFETGRLLQAGSGQAGALLSLPEKYAYQRIIRPRDLSPDGRMTDPAAGMQEQDSPEALLLGLYPQGQETPDGQPTAPDQAQAIRFYPDGSATELSFELRTPRGSRRGIRIHGLTGLVERLPAEQT